MAKFLMQEMVGEWDIVPARLGANTVANNGDLTDADVGKFVKFVGESRFALCAAGDDIEGWITSVEPASADGYAFGNVARSHGYKRVILDGLQATPGVGVIALGDYVLCGTVVAAKTALTATGGLARVVKATDQTVAKNSPYAARVVSLADTAVGSVALVEFLR